MKKTLIALAVAASAVSGMAHAWTNGDFNGSVDIGGNITADDYRQKWSWAVGSDINGFSNALADLTENGTKLTITVNGDKPILLGKTNEAFSTPVAGGVGAIPLISLSDATGNVQLLKGTNNAQSGVGTFDLEIKNRDTDKKIGTLRATMTGMAAAGIAGAENTGSLSALYAYGNTRIFSGGLTTESGSEMKDANTAVAFTEKMGSLSSADILSQIKQAKPNVVSLTPQTASVSENMKYDDGNVVSAAYALGFENGQTLEATFDEAITASTQWTAPLNISIAYN
ncbi:fimbrial protein [Escherichia coli]|uniref:F4 family fimbrial subunit n=1 Tax=Escherichia coli TaxID=562 RepID=UPI002739CA7D|nr:fimbrial protein [Escherichia coli]